MDADDPITLKCEIEHLAEQCATLLRENERLREELHSEAERLRAEALHWAEYESKTWKAMKAENERLREALQPFAEIACRLGWDKITADDQEWDSHVVEAPADDIASGAVYCLMVCAFSSAAAALQRDRYCDEW